LREIVETGEIDIDELDDVLAAQLGSIKGTVDWTHQDRIEGRRASACWRPQTEPTRCDW
jgi:hypothetical protein